MLMHQNGFKDTFPCRTERMDETGIFHVDGNEFRIDKPYS